MSKIVKLDNHLRSLIAAGEVVERPSNVVKELLENSIDAGSSEIIISLVESGIKEIKVVDNGSGMDKEDLLLCFYRHATSKIKNEYDLFRINSLGFRGEAISSIAAISKISITTNDSSGAYKLTYNGGVKSQLESASRNTGTTVVVKDLFYNTPARFKYLKSPTSELASITFFVTKIALANKNIRIVLKNNGKEIINTSGLGDMTRLFAEIYGLNVAKNISFVEYSSLEFDFRAVLTKPEITRSNKREITIICNDRYINNKRITDKILEAYDTYLFHGRYPVVLLELFVDPTTVDVNIHPKKSEIKISNENEIANKIGSIIKEKLSSLTVIPSSTENLDTKEQKKRYKDMYESTNLYGYKNVTLDEELSSVKKTSTDALSSIAESDISKTSNRDVSLYSELSTLPKLDDINVNNINQTDRNQKTEVESKKHVIIEEENNQKQDKEAREKFPSLDILGIYDNTYILCSGEKGLYLVDQHAAEERIRYEEITESILSRKLLVKPLLIPLNLDFSRSEFIFISSNLDKFKEIGFLFEVSGQNSYFIREIPSWLSEDVEINIRRIVDLFSDNKAIDIVKFEDRIAKQAACKASIKAHDKINLLEANMLLKRLKSCINPFNCPHGRPIIVLITEKEIEKLFKRVV